MANGHGGAREGAGRKPRRVKYAMEIESVEEVLAGELPRSAAFYLDVAHGRIPIVRRTYKPAGLIFVEDVETDPETNRTIKIKRRAFPDLDDREMVLVSETKETPHPDRYTLKDHLDRYLGRPGTSPEDVDPEADDADIRSAIDLSEELMEDGEERDDTFDPDAPSNGDDGPAGEGPGPLPVA